MLEWPIKSHMDFLTVVGLVVAFGLVAFAINLGGSLASFIDPVSILIVVGGTVGVIMVSHPLEIIVKGFGAGMKAIFNKIDKTNDLIDKLVELAEIAKNPNNGIIALEGEIEKIDDAFLANAIQVMLDNKSGVKNVIEELYVDSEQIEKRHKKSIAMFEEMAKTAPAMGMIGTLVGLVLMLQNMSDPSSIGPSMAVALLTTFYGALIANIIAAPIANKLRIYSEAEINKNEIIIAGVVSIMNGENPRKLKGKLQKFKPTKQRDFD